MDDASSSTAESENKSSKNAKKSKKTLPRRQMLAGRWLPPPIDAQCSYGEMAIWSAIAAEVAGRGRCDLDWREVAERAGAALLSVERAVKKARVLGLIVVADRRIDIVSPVWLEWIASKTRSSGPGSDRSADNS